MIRILALITAVLALAFAAAPLVTAPFSGFTADQLPIPQINPPVQPAGYAFAIWGVIYIWLVISALYGVLKRADDAAWHAARMPLIVSLAIGVPWLAIANASAIWATVTIWLMAIFAIWALVKAPAADRWLFQAPTALYAGWLTAASCVSLATVLAGYGIGPKPTVLALNAIVLAFVIAWLTHRRRTTAPEYLGAVIWALIGITLANWDSDIFVAIFAATGAIILTFRAIYPPSPDARPGIYR